jgi:hypothetical protein
MPRATVSARRLSEALHRKLHEATMQLHELWKTNSDPATLVAIDVRSVVHNFVSAARGVFPVAKTFGDDSLPKGMFDAWLGQWESRLDREAADLWKYIRQLRDDREHGDGMDLFALAIPLPRETNAPAALLLGVLAPPEASVISVRFGEYPDRTAHDVCFDYLEICRKFVRDFLQDHAVAIDSAAREEADTG